MDDSRPGFTSILSLDTTGMIDSSLVHVMYGMSKVKFPSFDRTKYLTTADRTFQLLVSDWDAWSREMKS